MYNEQHGVLQDESFMCEFSSSGRFNSYFSRPGFWIPFRGLFFFNQWNRYSKAKQSQHTIFLYLIFRTEFDSIMLNSVISWSEDDILILIVSLCALRVGRKFNLDSGWWHTLLTVFFLRPIASQNSFIIDRHDHSHKSTNGKTRYFFFIWSNFN